MKQKIVLLILAICMALVARPQTLVSQKTEKVFGFKNKMAVLKTRLTKTFEYQRSVPDSGYELVGAGDADLLPLRDVRVYEKVEASFPIKEIGLAGHYDTADYRKAFMNPGELVFTGESDTNTFLNNYFFNKDLVITRYGITFDQNVFTLDTDKGTTSNSTFIRILIVFLVPAFVASVWFLLPYILKGGNFFEKDNDAPPNRARNTILLGSVLLTVFPGGLIFLAIILDNNSVTIVPVYARLILFAARIVVAIFSLWVLNKLFKYIYERKEAKKQN